MADTSTAPQQQQQPMRYGDVDDDDDEYLSDDAPRQNGGGADGGDAEDDEYAKQQREQDMASAKALPANVKNFLTSFRSALSSNNVAQIHSLYSSGWNRLTQEHYAQNEWPEAEVVSCLTDNNEVFALFYKELFYRHIYSRLQPNIDDRFSSYENYCAIFNYILNSEGPVPVELPVQWLWDLVDEFVWQFSSFAQWRSRPKGKTDEEVALLAENPQVWSCYSVLNVLYSLIQKSKILDQLRVTKRNEEATEEVAGEYGSKPLYKLLGLFSLVTLVRVHVLLGDYTLALRMLDDVDMKRLPTRDVPAAHVSVHYHVGFSYLMLGRHADAIYHLSKGYFFYAGPKRGRNSVTGSDAVAKQADRMLALLAVSHALSPTKWDDSREVREAREALRSSEKYNDQFETMSRGGAAALPVFEELFKYGAPKTISPQSPSYGSASTSQLEALPDSVQHTVKLFMDDVRAVVDVPDLRTLLKLYTSIGTDKLAKLAGKDEDELIRELMVLKGSMKITKWTDGGDATAVGLLSGEEVVVGTLGFAVENSTINITEQRRARQFTGRFLSQGIGAKQLLDGLRSRPLPAPVLAGGASFGAPRENQQQNAPRPDAAQTQNKPHVAAAAGQKSVAWAASRA